MSELVVALETVKPTLVNTFKFPEENIQGYGRVPVQFGTKIVWADFVIYYYDKSHRKKAFCVVEVKEDIDRNVELAAPQAESYAQRLNAPYFVCTNGNVYQWYLTGSAQGESIPLAGSPALPIESYLNKPDTIYVSSYLYQTILNYEEAIKRKTEIYQDSKEHHEMTNELHEVLTDIHKLSNQDLTLDTLDKHLMNTINKPQLLRNIKDNYPRFRNMLTHLKATNVPVEIRLGNTMGKNSKFGIDNGGSHFITQLLAALYPDEYTVYDPRAAKAMRRFQLIDIDLKDDSVAEILLFNQICLELYPLFENPFRFNLSYVHNFFWHFEERYLPYKRWV